MPNAIVFEWDDVLYPNSILGTFSSDDFSKLDKQLESMFKSCLDYSDVILVARQDKWVYSCISRCLPRVNGMLNGIRVMAPVHWSHLSVSSIENAMETAKLLLMKDILRLKDYKSVSYISDSSIDISTFNKAITESIFSKPTYSKTLHIGEFPSTESFFLKIRTLEKKCYYISKVELNLNFNNIKELIKWEVPKYTPKDLEFPIHKFPKTRFTDIIPFSNINKRLSKRYTTATIRSGSVPSMSKQIYNIQEDNFSEIESDTEDENIIYKVINNTLTVTKGKKIYTPKNIKVKNNKLIIELTT